MDGNENNNRIESITDAAKTITISPLVLKNLAGWATFKAIIDIIVGALSCLGIITAAYGIPQIITGIRLINAADELKAYIGTNNTEKINMALLSMQKYFKLSGITIIIKICFIILFLALYGVIIALLITYMPDIINELPNTNFS